MSEPKERNQKLTWKNTLCPECRHCDADNAWCDLLDFPLSFRSAVQCLKYSPIPTGDAENQQEAGVTEKKTKNEGVDHPPHYNAHPSGVECIEVAEHFGFNLGNVIKYLWRAEEKGAPLEDLRKAQWYLRREIEKREKEVRQ